MLQLQAIESGYGESPVLRNVTMRVDQAKVVCLIGRNGVGKTTLMRTLTGQLKIRHGTMSLDEVDVTTWDSVHRARSGIGYVPQGREIFPMLTVKENLLLGLEPCNPQPKAFPEDVIELFPVLPQMYHRQGGDLSGGQQQQLAFARALASRPKLLLLDEPTEGIQPSIVEEIRNVICKIKAQGNTSVILVEQSIDFVRSVADYIYVMDKGSIVAQGDPEHIDIEQFEHYLTV
ncbi:urea transport system ATP-binding protein [Fontibacillus solani]|uniref:Urea transport system ATP-binding protein n=1 Tax=Fontibacillus solani TaxID=1572857 RepID=A0A7W3XTV3_9BACL|nr:urea ABC transporter ATP-binding subunit UrtE [Fontibacillus solani]MBA9087995.1 urea transport system ATP-binding protein [Fontibacillus solani]